MSHEVMIGSEFRYEGEMHPGIRGYKVKVIAIHRREKIIDSPGVMIRVRDKDFLEIAPWLDRAERWSFVTSDAVPADLIPV